MKMINPLFISKPVHTRKKTTTGLRSFLLLVLCPVLLHAAPDYIASEIPRSQDSGQPFFADMDGDGRHDVLVSHWGPAQGRELYIYLQQDNGLFPAEPSRRVEVKPEIIAVTTTELGDNPGDELIFFTSDAVYSFSSAIESYSGNLRKIIDWPLIATTPHRKQLFYFGELPDLNNDGLNDFLLPYDKGVAYFRATEDNQFVLQSTINTIGEELFTNGQNGVSVSLNSNQFLDDQGNIVLNISSPTSSQFKNFLSRWEPESSVGTGDNVLLRTNNWTPAVVLTSIVGSLKSDIVYLNDIGDDKEQLFLLTQDEAGSFTEQTGWQSIIDDEGFIQLVDYSGDGLDDIIRIVQEGDDSNIYFYLNKNSAFTFDSPDQVMRFSGLGLAVDFIDFNNDNKPELSINFYTIPVIDMLRNPRVQRTRLIYNNNSSTADVEQPVFSRRPDFSLEESFIAEAFLALNPSGSLKDDLNGDEQMDYLYIATDGTLKARTINSDTLQIDTEEFWQYVPNHAIVNIDIEELNNDSNPDLILHHSLHFTLLVSTQ